MYPGTIVNIIDRSYLGDLNSTSVDNSPLYLTVSSFDRGPEDLRVVKNANDFYALYGQKMNFAKHGQPAIQAANDIMAGARLLIKRLVADDALLGNLILTVTVTAKTVAKKAGADETGVSLQYLKTGVEDEGATDKYIVDSEKSTLTLKWESTSVTNCKTPQDVLNQVKASEDPSVTTDGTDEVTITKTGKYTMFVITDNGRSADSKSVRIVSDYSLSKNMSDMIYDVIVYDGSTILDSATATMNPKSVYNNTLYGFSEYTTPQLKFYTIDGEFEKYVSFIASSLGLTEDEVKQCDLINGRDSRNAALTGVTVDAESVDLGSVYGIEVANGSDGAFKDKAFGTDEWTTKAVEVFDGTFDDSIWDVDTYKIAAIFDANYPEKVKNAIAEFVNFRKDCAYFRDYGLDCFTYNSIMEHNKSINKDYKVFNIGDYFTTYMIYDPETKLRERVTMMYDFSAAVVPIFADGAYRPMAGFINNVVLPSAIEGTINFVPKVTPKANQKAMIDDARINYAIFMEGQCVVQSLYTSKQGVITQLCYMNNTLAIQEVARALRTACPKFRYTFVTGTDFQVYADACNSVLQNFKSHFAELTFTYVQDPIESMHKIFHAAIQFKFGNWAQTEIFDLYALPNDTES